MKKLFLIFCLLIVGWQSSLFADKAGVLTIGNPQIVCNQLKFDLYLKSVGSTLLYFSDSDLGIFFPNLKFSSTTATFTPASGKLTTYYQFAPTIYTSNTLYISVFSQYVTTQAAFDQKIQAMSTTGTGTYLGTVTIGDIIDFSGSMDITWRTSFPYYTNVNALDSLPSFPGSAVSLSYQNTTNFVHGPYFDGVVKNQQLSGSDFLFDIFMKQNSGPQLYVGNDTLRFTFNSSLFTNPTVSIVTTGTAKLANYTMQTSIQGTNIVSLALTAPTITTQTEFGNKIEIVTSATAGTKIATVKISGVNSGASLLNISPQWASGANISVVRTRKDCPNWDAGANVTTNGNYSVVQPSVNLILGSPNGNQLLCAGNVVQITWASVNISSINIDLVPQTGSTTNIVSNYAAISGSFSWTVPTTSGNFKVKITDVGTGLSDDSDAFFAINLPAQITLQPHDVSICNGGSAVFSVAASSSPSATIQWQISSSTNSTWQNIANATATTLTLTNVQTSQNLTYYKAIFTNQCGSVSTSFATLTVNNSLTISSQPQSLIACKGDTVSFAVGSVGATNFQWQISTDGGSNWQNITGATQSAVILQNIQTTLTNSKYRINLSNNCEQSTTSNVATLIVNAPPTVTLQPQSAVGCANGSIQFTASGAGTPSPIIQWQVSVNNGLSWSNIQGETSNSVSLSGIALFQNNYWYRALFTNACGSTPSTIATLNVGSSPQLAAQPQSQTACLGDNISFFASASGAPFPSIQWQSSTNGGNSWINIQTTGLTQTVLNVSLSMSGTKYRAVFSNQCSSAVYSNEAILTVHSPVQITSQPQDIALCPGQTAQFQISATGEPIPAIQWQSSSDGGNNWHNISGETSATMSFFAQISQNQSRFRALLSNYCSSSLISTTALLTVNSPPVILSHPQNISACEGGNSAFQVSITGTPTPFAQWQFSGDGGANWANISGATQATLQLNNIPKSANGNKYRAILSNVCGNNVLSSSAVLTVNYAPQISLQPQDKRACSGDTVRFISASISQPSASVKWQESFDNGNTWVLVSGANKDTLTLANIQLSQNNLQVRAIYFNACADSVPTQVASLTIPAKPIISQQPISKTVLISNSVSFDVTVTGQNIQYQWYKTKAALVDNSRISGSQTSHLSISNVGVDDVSNEYFVIVSGECGAENSQLFALNLIVPGITITSQPKPITICEGGNITFSVSATSSITGATLSYQWRKGTTLLTDGAKYTGVTSTTLQVINALTSDAASNYNALITIMPGGGKTSSDNVSLVVNVIPAILQKPQDATVCAGDATALDVLVSGSEPISYQWFFNNQQIQNANSHRLLLNSVTSGTVGAYKCTVSNSCGKITSDVAQISLKPETKVTSQPVKAQTINEGKQLSISVAASGSGNLSYQWYKNGVIIPNATSPNFNISQMTVLDTGSYVVVIKAECGEISSDTSKVYIILTDVKEDYLLAQNVVLEQNYPNPFAKSTTIPFVLSSLQQVRLSVRDVLGREIMVIFNDILDEGKYDFTIDCSEFPTGTYFYTAVAGGKMLVKQMMIVR